MITKAFPNQAAIDNTLMAIEMALDTSFDDLHDGIDLTGEDVLPEGAYSLNESIPALIAAYESLGGDPAYADDCRTAFNHFKAQQVDTSDPYDYCDCDSPACSLPHN